MSRIVEEMADELARDAIDAAERLKDENLIRELSEVLEAGSSTANEAFMTAVRIRLAVKRGRKWLDTRVTRAETAPKPAATPASGAEKPAAEAAPKPAGPRPVRRTPGA
ncbi:hypothetical protein [Actibacterium sp. XHP0104]|uniref:hypothetical protein n=1 Tax=Actibacterium sp. XHP0104 TaxID=2984335 RepID=UPI0021E7F344|nr:hypothetical protein [Actibacterium sp. XHP0104]MCV2881229.1 hypothetical protein [Actibacterium sp. XHP0104]